MEVFETFGGTLLSVDEAPTVLEGNWEATRFVLISFPSHDAVMAWYNSDGYQAIVKHRHAASVMNAVISTGLDELAPPPPPLPAPGTTAAS